MARRHWGGAADLSQPGQVDKRNPPAFWMAVLLGGIITAFRLHLILASLESDYAHVVAIAQILCRHCSSTSPAAGSKTHFHVFGSLAILAFSRDWRVLVTATVLLQADHFVRGMFAPQSVYGVSVKRNSWRGGPRTPGVGHIEDTFLILSCIQSLPEMRGIAERQAQVEQSRMWPSKRTRRRARSVSHEHELRTAEWHFGIRNTLGDGGIGTRNQESVDQILHAGRHLLGLINEVLDISRLNPAVFPSRSNLFDRRGCSRGYGLIRPVADGRGVHL